jgi:hypothetical protein
MVKKQILFVEDNRNVFDGLRRMNRAQRDGWDAYYALSGAEAFKIMDARHNPKKSV